VAVQDDETSLVTAASPVERAHIEFVPGPDPAGLEAHGIGEDRRAGRARAPSTVAPCTRHSGARRPDSGLTGHPDIQRPPHSHRCTGPASATRPSWAGHRVADTPPATPASAALQGRISAARLADHDCRGRVRPGRSFDHVPAPPLPGGQEDPARDQGRALPSRLLFLQDATTGLAADPWSGFFQRGVEVRCDRQVVREAHRFDGTPERAGRDDDAQLRPPSLRFLACLHEHGDP